MFGLSPKQKKEMDGVLAELKAREDVQEMKNYVQHGRVSTFAHCEAVAALSYVIARGLRLRVNLKTLLIGAMLHDFYLYDWHVPGDGSHRWHGFTHADRALRNVNARFTVNDQIRHVIWCHMWPLNLTRVPRSREAWIVCVADKLVSLRETLFLR